MRIAKAKLSLEDVTSISEKVCVTEGTIKEEEEYQRIIEHKLEEEKACKLKKSIAEDAPGRQEFGDNIKCNIDETCK